MKFLFSLILLVAVLVPTQTAESGIFFGNRGFVNVNVGRNRFLGNRGFVNVNVGRNRFFGNRVFVNRNRFLGNRGFVNVNVGRNRFFGNRVVVNPFFNRNVVASPVVVRGNRAFITTPFVSGTNFAQPVFASGGFIQPQQFVVNPSFVDPSFRAVRSFATPGFSTFGGSRFAIGRSRCGF